MTYKIRGDILPITMLEKGDNYLKKRFLAVLIALSFVLSGCNAKNSAIDTPSDKDTAPTAVGDKTSFKLSYLPDIGEYKKEAAPKRWYEDYIDELKPSDEYGELSIYIGKISNYTIWDDYDESMEVDDERALFGFCTKDGTIVTDPVFDRIELCDGYYFYSKPVKKTYQSDGENMEFYNDAFFLTPTDGSKVLQFKTDDAYGSYYGDGIFGFGSGDIGDFFDAEGNNLTQNSTEDSNYIRAMYGGAMICFSYGDSHQAYFVDRQFKRTSDKTYEDLRHFFGDYFLAELDGKYGLVDKNDKVILPFEYDELFNNYDNEEHEAFAARKDSEIIIMDDDFKELFSVTPDNINFSPLGISDKTVVVDNNKLYHKNGKVLIGEENWFYNDDGIYSGIYGGKLTVVDDELNILEEFDAEYMSESVDKDNDIWILTKQLDDGSKLESIAYNRKTKEFIKDIRYNGSYSDDSDLYYVKGEDGKYYAHRLSNNEKLFPCSGIVFKVDTPSGELYGYENGDYTYTVNEKFEEILKIRTQRD